MSANQQDFLPPSDALDFKNGVWQPRIVSAVSYPEEGNDVAFQIENESYWFAHRNQCLLTLMEHFAPGGPIYDIGGGNGFVSAALQRGGYEAVLVEPGNGARNALKRGVDRVICATLQDCSFHPKSLTAVGAFDVVEHIEEDHAFLEQIHRLLVPGGRFYATVPAFQKLWSDEDVYAGHFRRYTRQTWSRVLELAGFEVEYVSCIFAWLSIPVLLLRSLPYHLRANTTKQMGTFEAVKSDHRLPPSLAKIVQGLHHWELSRLVAHKTIPLGTSLISVARKA